MYNSFSEIQTAIQNNETVENIVNQYLDRIEKNKDLNAFLDVFDKTAIEKAKEVDEKIKSNKAGKLAGMVIGLKDNLCYKDHKVSASSKILENFQSIYSATVVERLLAEDAIIIGRLNCDEFAMGSSNENSAFGAVKNAVDKSRVPGGSSGGSATAVAAKLCTVALGSDTGGSIRQPASFTGTVGLKPTYGRVSRYGLIAYASSFDQIGPFSQNVEDAALVLEVIAGEDEYDSTVSSKPTEEYSKFEDVKSLKIGFLDDCFNAEGLDEEVKEGTLKVVEKLKAENHQVDKVSFKYIPYMVPTYYVLTTAEASSNLARFDGVHYGHRSENAVGVEETYVKSRSEGFGDEVKRRIMTGTFVLSQGYYDAYYAKAQKVRRLIKDKTEKLLEEYDLILLPTAPSVAFKQGAVKDNIQMYLQDIFTVQANLAGNPAISLPLCKNKEGLPFGIQLIGKKFGEKQLLSASDYMMKLFK